MHKIVYECLFARLANTFAELSLDMWWIFNFSVSLLCFHHPINVYVTEIAKGQQKHRQQKEKNKNPKQMTDRVREMERKGGGEGCNRCSKIVMSAIQTVGLYDAIDSALTHNKWSVERESESEKETEEEKKSVIKLYKLSCWALVACAYTKSWSGYSNSDTLSSVRRFGSCISSGCVPF